jgi:hypothetical protein
MRPLDVRESVRRAFITLVADARAAAGTDEGLRASKVICAFACVASPGLCACVVFSAS